MSLYHYVAKDLTGKKFIGDVESLDEKALVTTLQGQGLVPVEIRKRNTSRSVIRTFLPSSGVSSSETLGFTRQLSTMISAGLPLTDALVILEKQTKNQNFAHVISEIVAGGEGRIFPSTVPVRHQKTFLSFYIKQ